MKKINLPLLRQNHRYDCGAKALQSVLVYYGVELREDIIMREVKTSKKGTSVKNILNVAREHGLKTESREMGLEDIKEYIKKKIPIILVLQAWTKRKKIDWEKDWNDGHYVVAVGYTKDKVIFDDPSSFERTYLKYNELEKRWHDVDGKGNKYLHYGIAIFGKKPKFSENILVHMR